MSTLNCEKENLLEQTVLVKRPLSNFEKGTLFCTPFIYVFQCGGLYFKTDFQRQIKLILNEMVELMKQENMSPAFEMLNIISPSWHAVECMISVIIFLTDSDTDVCKSMCIAQYFTEVCLNILCIRGGGLKSVKTIKSA